MQAASGNTAYPGVKKTKEGYEFTLQLSRGKEAALAVSYTHLTLPTIA